MALILAVCACSVLVFAMLVFLVYMRCPEDFTLEISITRWATLKVRLKSPKSIRK